MQKKWLYNVIFAQRKISNWITSENNKKSIFFIRDYYPNSPIFPLAVSSSDTANKLMSYNYPLPDVLQYFTNTAAKQNVAVLQHIWLYEIIGGTLPMCQNTTMRVNGAWIIRYWVYVQTHTTPCTVVITSLLVRHKPLGTPASVKRVYCLESGIPSTIQGNGYDSDFLK